MVQAAYNSFTHFYIFVTSFNCDWTGCRLKSEGRKSVPRSRKSTAEGEVVPKEKFERTKSSLEAELRDIRERYFHMSLKYAEVEANREELVMKLKASNSGKRWL